MQTAHTSGVATAWQPICHVDELIPGMGVSARAYGLQIAIFRTDEGIFALDNLDPFSHAAVLSRGIVGDLKGRLVVASPMYKQHFCLRTGLCIEDEAVSVRSWLLRQDADGLLYAASPQTMEAKDHELV
ncbi:nitrite reductase small subunit NirD [Pusillimonas sp.]|uniref:nitrite reductase small subunit NirD n=1 Tax=Pusillimonas sp. TaxID=3040095 RepID=UPI0037CB5C5E